MAAFDNPECQVPVGEARPDLHEACAAEAMVRLALLQRKCVRKLSRDWERIIAVGKANLIAKTESATQEEYYRLVEDRDAATAQSLWDLYMCRSVPPEALAWVDAFPEPPGDPAILRDRRPITQQFELFDAASRLGAEVPAWVLQKRADS